MKNLPLPTLILIGVISAFFVITISAMNWRRSVYAALIVALFEGAIRKWIIPQASELVYFLKDIILIGAYLRFYMAPEPGLKAWHLRVPMTLILVMCGIVAMTGALNPNIGSALLAAYGIKIYMMYLPLAFMMPFLFQNEEDMANKLFLYSILCIPICLLGAAQFVAGPDSWLNVYAQSAFAEMRHVATFGAGSERARITGTFSYISGHAVFLIAFFGLSVALLGSLEGKKRLVVMAGNLPLLAANGLMAGSRGAVFSMLIIGGSVLMTTSVLKVGRKGKNFLPFLIVAALLTVAGVSYFFKDAYTAFETRRKTAGDTNSGRMMYVVNSVIKASDEVGIIGFGIGMSHPASAALRSALKIELPKKKCPVYDAETGQVLAELGWPGFVAWYCFRIMVVFHCWEAFRRSRPSAFRTLSLVFFVFQALTLPGSMVLNHTANLFVFAAWGFCLRIRVAPLITRRSGSSAVRRPTSGQRPGTVGAH